MKQIYLDHNATSPIDPRVTEVISQCYRDGYANPASQHQPGRRARRLLEETREEVTEILGGGRSDRLIFTSGATEANNLALRGLAGRAGGRVIVSAIEHPSVTGVAEHLRREGFEITWLGASRNGVIDLEQLRQSIDQQTLLVSVMLGNHETGVLQPVQSAAEICAKAGVAMHTDATQAVGKMEVNFRRLGVVAMSLSAHKFSGPVGVGALLVRRDTPLEPILHGGFQQLGLRPGSESVALAVGLLAALKLCQTQEPRQRMAAMRDHLESLLSQGWPQLVAHGAGSPRLSNTSCVSFVGLDRQALLMALDLAGVACSSGSACASGSSEPSPVLGAMGCPEAELRSALRLSLGGSTTEADIDQAASRILGVCSDLRRKSAASFSPRTSRPPA